MDRYEEIEKSYKHLGKAGSIYDGIVTYSTPVGKLINKMMWGFNKETTAEWMNSAMSGIPADKIEAFVIRKKSALMMMQKCKNYCRIQASSATRQN